MPLSEMIYEADELREPSGFSNVRPVYMAKQTNKQNVPREVTKL